MLSFSIVVALDAKNGIGKNGLLPWYLKADLKHFKEITTKTTSCEKKNVVIMGRKTWDSLPAHFRPLPERINLVLTRNQKLPLPEGVIKADQFQNAFAVLSESFLQKSLEHIFVIGGQQIFEAALKEKTCEKIYATHIERNFLCDTFFPSFKTQFEKCSSSINHVENNLSFCFKDYIRKSNKFS